MKRRTITFRMCLIAALLVLAGLNLALCAWPYSSDPWSLQLSPQNVIHLAARRGWIRLVVLSYQPGQRPADVVIDRTLLLFGGRNWPRHAYLFGWIDIRTAPISLFRFSACPWRSGFSVWFRQWLLTPILLAYPTITTCLYYGRRYRRRRRNLCVQCGYNLTGNTSGRCPDCGTNIVTAAKSPSPST